MTGKLTLGIDQLFGEEGNDNLYGDAGNDTLSGGNGFDFLDGGTGNDILDGGAGDDVYLVDSVFDQVIETPSGGWDIVQSFVSWTLSSNFEQLILAGSALDGTGNDLDNFINGNDLANTLDGKDGADFLFGRAGNDTLIGGTGDDYLLGGIGNDIMDGGAGNDWYIVDSVFDQVIETSTDGYDVVSSSVSWTLSSNIEQLFLHGSALNGIGSELDNNIYGNSLDNTLDGKDGADFLSGAGGNDTLIGGNGVDRLDGGTGNDQMEGGLGDDTYVIDALSDIVVELAGQGADTIQSTITYSLVDSDGAGSNGGNVENLTLLGNAAIDGTGNASNNVLIGNQASNRLDGGSGADTMQGGLGDDTYVVDTLSDIVTEFSGQGNDTIQSAISYSLVDTDGAGTKGGNVDNLTLTGSAVINGTGNKLANVINGSTNTAANVLTGGLGDDTYIVAAGDTVVENENAGIELVQSSVSFTLGTNVENLTLTGSGNINATGNALSNILVGNTGANILDGKAGADDMTGGMGNDTYVIDDIGDIVNEALSAGTDTVQSYITHTLFSNFENLTLLGTAAISGTGNAVANTINGSLNSAANVLAGGLLNDTYIVGAGDTVIENSNEGTDIVNSSVTFTLSDNVENLTLTSSAVINGIGNVLANTINGSTNTAANVLTGKEGNDTYIVGAGDTVIEALNDGTDTVNRSLSEFLCEGSHMTIMSFYRKDSYDNARQSHPGQAAGRGQSL